LARRRRHALFSSAQPELELEEGEGRMGSGAEMDKNELVWRECPRWLTRGGSPDYAAGMGAGTGNRGGSR